MNETEANQSAKDNLARKQYSEWVNSLSPEKRRWIDREHPELLKADYGYEGNRQQSDVSEHEIADTAINGSDNEPEILKYTQGDLVAMLRRMVSDLVAFPCPSLSDVCIQIVLNIGNPPTETEAARLFGVTRAAVSKRCIYFMDTYGIGPPQYL